LGATYPDVLPYPVTTALQLIQDPAVSVLQVDPCERRGEILNEVALQQLKQFPVTFGHRVAVFRGGETPRQKDTRKTSIAKIPLEFAGPGDLISGTRERSLLGADPDNRGADAFRGSCHQYQLVSESRVHGTNRGD
jgi:hypothetical protein